MKKIIGLPLLMCCLVMPAIAFTVLLPAEPVEAKGTDAQTDAAARRAEADRLLQQGIQQSQTGQFRNALQSWQQALEQYQDPVVQSAFPQESRLGAGNSLGNMGIAYRNLGQYQQAIEFFEQSLGVAREVGDRVLEGNSLGNLGNTYADLGQYQQALEFHEQHLALVQDVGASPEENWYLRQGEGRALGNLGIAHHNLGQYQQAVDYFAQSLVIFREMGDRLGEVLVLGNLGNTHNSLGRYQQAINFYEQQLVMSREMGDRAGESTGLGNLGVAYQRLGQYQAALERFQQALVIAQETGDRPSEGLWLRNIGAWLVDQEQPELAIVFYKQSVNVQESIRADIQGLSQQQQQSFTETIADSYRRLADLLLQQNRILEAQEVLDLLKLQELQDYELQNVRGTLVTQQGLDFWPSEQVIINLFNQSLANPTEVDFETFLNRSEVISQIEQLQRNARGQNLNPEQLIRLQDNLQQVENTALLYPLILGDRLELILVTPNGLVRETVSVDQDTLNAALAEFRHTISDPRRHRRPATQAQALYQWLFAPIADDLEQAGIDTVLYAADGALRYIPLAALHDGEQWLIQRYTINHITAASLTEFSQSERRDIKILAGAFPSEAMEVAWGGERVRFSGLPYAQVEVQNLVNQVTNTTALYGRDFNRSAIAHLNNYSIIHLATHAEFRSGRPSDSFILLGDGDRITLADLNQWQLPNVDLVVLSACQTAVSSDGLGNGEEILGFGYQIQQTGAQAAIASLWSVDDGGTQLLMTAFYDALSRGYSKAEALRQAQIALITSGDYHATPYYWAPFILIGNGM